MKKILVPYTIYRVEDHGPAKEDGIFFHKDMIAIKQGEKTVYYGDWEIVVSHRGE